MIYVRLNDKSFSYNVCNITRMFYKGEKVVLQELDNKTCNNVNIEIYREDALILKLSVKKDASLSINNKEVSRQVYLALNKLTGKEMPWGILTGIRPAKIVYEMIESGMDSKEILNKLNNFYLISPKKASLAYSVAQTESRFLKSNADDIISLYLGIPFCTTRCNYCSFASNSINKYSHLVDKYLDCLKKEIKIISDDIINKYKLKIQTIYIGGGTPTAINQDQLKDLLWYIEDTLDLKDLEEYTLEAGRPDTIDIKKLEVIKSSKVDRISINPQSMNLQTLKTIGRNHRPEDIIRAFYQARDMGFNNINMDVIVGLPGENIDMFKYTMDKIKELAPENLTVHSLSIKRASQLREDIDDLENRADALLADDKLANSMTDMSYEYALSMGMHPYYLYRQKNIAGNLENVGYCKPGFESIYNIQIMEEKQTIIALGAGAVTKVVYNGERKIERAFNVKDLGSYINRVEEMAEKKKGLFQYLKTNHE